MKLFFPCRLIIGHELIMSHRCVLCCKIHRCLIRMTRPETCLSVDTYNLFEHWKAARYGDSAARWHSRIRHESPRYSLLVNTVQYRMASVNARRHSSRKSAISDMHELPFRYDCYSLLRDKCLGRPDTTVHPHCTVCSRPNNECRL